MELCTATNLIILLILIAQVILAKSWISNLRHSNCFDFSPLLSTIDNDSPCDLQSDIVGFTDSGSEQVSWDKAAKNADVQIGIELVYENAVSHLYSIKKDAKLFSSAFIDNVADSNAKIWFYKNHRSLFNMGISSLLKNDEIDTADKILKDVVNYSRIHNLKLLEADTINAFIQHAFQMRKPELADDFFDKYFHRNKIDEKEEKTNTSQNLSISLLPCANTRTFNIIMEGHRSCGNNVTKVKSYFKNMLNVSNMNQIYTCRPDSYTYSTLFRVAATRDDLIRYFNQAYCEFGCPIIMNKSFSANFTLEANINNPLPLPLVRIAIESLGKLGYPGDAMEVAYFYLLLPLSIRDNKEQSTCKSLSLPSTENFSQSYAKIALPSSLGGDALFSALLSRKCTRNRIPIQFIGGIIRPILKNSSSKLVQQNIMRAFYKDVVYQFDGLQSGIAALLLSGLAATHSDKKVYHRFMQAYPGSRGFTLLLSSLKVLSLQLLGQKAKEMSKVRISKSPSQLTVKASVKVLYTKDGRGKYDLNSLYAPSMEDQERYKTNGHSYQYSMAYDTLREAIQNRLLLAMELWVSENTALNNEISSEKNDFPQLQSSEMEGVLINGRICDSLLRSYIVTNPTDISAPKELMQKKLLPLTKRSEKVLNAIRNESTIYDIQSKQDGPLFQEVAEKALESLIYCCGRSDGKNVDTALEIARTARRRNWPYNILQKLAFAYFSGKKDATSIKTEYDVKQKDKDNKIQNKRNKTGFIPFLATSYVKTVEASIRAELGYYPEDELNCDNIKNSKGEFATKKIRVILK